MRELRPYDIVHCVFKYAGIVIHPCHMALIEVQDRRENRSGRYAQIVYILHRKGHRESGEGSCWVCAFAMLGFRASRAFHTTVRRATRRTPTLPRIYRYWIDVHGQLFLYDTVPKNLTSCAYAAY